MTTYPEITRRWGNHGELGQQGILRSVEVTILCQTAKRNIPYVVDGAQTILTSLEVGD